MKTAEKEITEDKTIKRKRGRSSSPPYPRDSLERALRLAKAIEENNAGDPYDRLDLAQSVEMTPESSTFRTLITSSGRYGLTSGGYAADKIELTPLGSAIVAPTVDENQGDSLRAALLNPELFKNIYEKFNKKSIPRKEVFKSTLKKEFGVEPQDLDSCYNVIMKNMEDFQLLQDFNGKPFLNLEKLGNELVFNENEGTNGEEGAGEEQEGAGEEQEGAGEEQERKEIKIEKPRVFISHSKNMKILGQIKQMLEFGNFDYEVAVERETTAIPIPEKIFGLMRKCNCAVINVSADEHEKRDDESYGINQNVLIEIGAAFLAYDRKVILLVDKRIDLPSNLQGLYRSYYEGDELSWETGMKLQEALTQFREKKEPDQEKD